MTDQPTPGNPLPNPLDGLPIMTVPEDAAGGDTGVDTLKPFNSSPADQHFRDVIRDDSNTALKYFNELNEPLAASLLKHYLGSDGAALGSDYVFSEQQMDRIIHAPSVQNTINHGQWIQLGDDHKWHSSDTPGQPGAVYQRGLNDEVSDAIARARADHSLYGQQQNVVVPWMNTTTEQDDQDRNDLTGTGHDVHNSLGKFHTGATGKITVTPVNPADPDGPVRYSMDYGIHVWDFEKFNHTDHADKENEFTKIKININNNIGLAHERGVGRNYQDYGTSGIRNRSGVVGADGRPIGNTDDGYKHLQAWQEGGPLTIQPWRKEPSLPDYLMAWLSEGGDVKGPGSSIGDKIAARLSDGEFVVNAASANANRPLLKAINDDPNYMMKYTHRMEQMVAAALTKVRTRSDARGEHVDQSTAVHISAYDVHEAFAKAKLWEQRRAMVDS